MRLVFQPLLDAASAQDVGFHAFYTIRNDEVPGAVAALRELATMAPEQAGALRISPALSDADPEPYASTLRAFVRRYGGQARLVRLTINAIDLRHEALVWDLRGVEKQGTAFVDMAIAGSTALLEQVALVGNSGYEPRPVADTPAGLQTALNETTFSRAEAVDKRASLEALAAVENPLSNTSQTVACVGCHVSTVVMSLRSGVSAIDPLTLDGRYTSGFDLSTAGGKSAETPRTLRALGYLARTPLISQRVVNETAQTLAEIEQRFP